MIHPHTASCVFALYMTIQSYKYSPAEGTQAGHSEGCMANSMGELFARRGLSYDRLRVLMEVAESGSIAEAAGREPVRQSQYSRQLKELAEFFGVELTRREGKSMALTQAGQRLAVIAREHLAALAGFDTECRGKLVEVSLGAGDSVIQWLILPRMSAVREAVPNASFDLRNLRTDETVAGVRDMRLDFGIVRAETGMESLKRRRLGRMEYALFVPEPLIPQRKKTEGLRELLDGLPMATLNAAGELTRQFTLVTDKLRIRPSVRLQCSTLPQAFQAVQTGHYAAVLPTLAQPLAEVSGIRVFGGKSFAAMARDLDLVWSLRTERIRPVVARLAEAMAAAWRC